MSGALAKEMCWVHEDIAHGASSTKPSSHLNIDNTSQHGMTIKIQIRMTVLMRR